MDDHGRPHRGPGRFLAPLALAATILVVYLIVSGNERSGSGTAPTGSTAPRHHGGGSARGHGRPAAHAHGPHGSRPGHGGSPAGGSPGRTSSTATTTTGTSTSTTGVTTTGPGEKFYVVQAGDTMAIISEKTHVPLATIEALNPRVSSNAMSIGQRLRIRK